MANLTDVLNFRSNLTGADIKSLYEAEPNAFVDSDKSKIDSLYYIPTTTITTNYDAADKDEVRCDSSGGTFTITLPASGSVKIVDIIGVDADTGFGATGLHVTLVPQPGTTILGETSLDLDVGASRLVFTLYGSDWKLIDVSAPRFVVSDWNDLNNKPNFVDSSTVSTSYDGTNVSSEIIFPVSGASFTAPLTLPNNSRVNGVEHFYQETPPTTRGDGSALVDGDIWYKPGDRTWIRKEIYWVSAELIPVGIPPFSSLSTTGNSSTITVGTIVYVEKVHWSFFLMDRVNDANDYWTLKFDVVSYGNALVGTSCGTFNTIGFNNSIYYSGSLDVNAVIIGGIGDGGSVNLKWWTRHDKTGSNSNRLSYAATLYYRTVYE